MPSVLVPEDAASLLSAIVLAFNREISGSLLDEADELVKLGLATSAVLIAGTVLEYVESGPVASAVPAEHRSEVAAWRQLRNQVAHGSSGTVSVAEARRVIDGVRRILVTPTVSGEPVAQSGSEASLLPHAVKGKYAHVPTSSADFMRRKHEELELEDHG